MAAGWGADRLCAARGRPEVCDGLGWHTWQLEVGGGWSDTAQGWFSHGTPPGTTCSGTPAIARDLNGLCNLFAVDGNGALWRISQVRPSSDWTDWIAHGTPATTTLWASPAVTTSEDGRLEVFVVGADSNLWHIWQTDANGNWSDWYSHRQPG